MINIDELEVKCAAFLKDARRAQETGMKATGIRARVESSELAKIFKEFRKESIHYTKPNKAE